MSELVTLSYEDAIAYDGQVAIITLINPAKRNTLAGPVMTAIIGALQEVATSEALGVIIAAEGPAFSAGHDFTDMAGATLADAQELFDICEQMMTLIQQIPQVVIAQVQGIATAAGCQLVASCDLAVASDQATFQTPGGKGGLFCHTPMVAVSRAVGRKKALEMALTGDPVDADTACDWGLVNRVVPHDELASATRYLMRRATRGSAYSKAQGKRSFYGQIELEQKDAYSYAGAVMAAGVTSADGQEGIASFMEKRPPTWTNR
ncbi:MAG: enoyl-CoA hydratase-related protein [Actinomycetota bacterium]|jgi:enoyl-CoA hydratase/carnithine racemase|nr:enoyl-CoA hydratase-related protein [Actinomycetota bacterium]